MSRHRDVRNIKRADYDYSDDDTGSYGSYGSYEGLSPSSSQFIYRRGDNNALGGYLQEENRFEEDYGRRYDDEYDSALERCIDEVGAVLGYEGWTREEFCEAIERSNYDSEKATAYLLEQKEKWEKGLKSSGGGGVFEIEFDEGIGTQSAGKAKGNNNNSRNNNNNKGKKGEQVNPKGAKPKPAAKPAAKPKPKPGAKPGPAQSKPKGKPVTLTIEATEPTTKGATGGKAKPSPGKGTEKELGASTEPPKEESTPKKKVQQNTPSHRKDLTKRIADAAAKNSKKEHLNMVVIGHVDAGKSTIMGHLLYLLGEVSSKTMHRYQKDSKDIGKASFSFAWVLDEHAEERARGITMDVGVTHLETEHKKITLLDAPGHRDFVPNMISGAAQADVSVLVINALPGEFEAGFTQDGQTKEHALLARSLGITQMIVAVNKMDGVEWSQQRFDEIKEKLGVYFKQVALNAKNVTFIPISGLLGENLSEQKDPKLLSWYKGPTLVQAIDSFKPATRMVDQPFRLCLSDVYKNMTLGNAVGGKVEAGLVSVSDKLMIMPLGEICTVKSLMSHNEQVEWAVAGENVDLGLTGPDLNAFHVGDVLCDPEHPIPVTKKFRAQILVFALQIPITKGYQVMLHAQSLQVPACVAKLVSIIDPTSGHTKKKRPRCLNEKASAVVEITTQLPICLELYRDYKQLGRFMLRVHGRTIAAGIVTEFL